MNPVEKREMKRQAWMRLTAQRRRAGLLRGRVLALSMICFTLLWGIVFVQMATGNDPVLSGKEKATATRTLVSGKRDAHKAEARETEPERDEATRPREEEEEEEELDGEPAEEFEAVEPVEEVEAAEPEFEEVEEVEPAEEFEEVEPEFVEEPLVTSQS